MAKPQLEDGHTRIANELLEHLMTLNLSPNSWQVLLCIIRKTYGFQKKVDYIANKQIVEATGLGKSVVSRNLRHLVQMNIIHRNHKSIGIQKDWELWGKVSSIANNEKLAVQPTIDTELAEQLTNEKLAEQSTELAEQLTQVSSIANQKLAAVLSHKRKKETYTKETKQKKDARKKYGEFQNILLTDEEHQKLIDKLGEVKAAEWIEELSFGIESKGYKFQNHYATILNWVRRDQKNGGSNGAHKRSAGKLTTQYTDPDSLRW